MWPFEVLDVPEVFGPHLAFQTEASGASEPEASEVVEAFESEASGAAGASGSEASEAPEAPELEAGSYLASHAEPELADSRWPPPST